MEKTDVVKVELEVPIKLWDTLRWYIEFTDYWISNDEEEKVCKDYIVDSLRCILQSEADSGVPDAARFIAKELKEHLEPFKEC
jgi:hypothetical protein